MVHNRQFDDVERDSIYALFECRRDMRHFITHSTVDESALMRILGAAHQAPSVGMMQPWRYIRIQSRQIREKIYTLVADERLATADALSGRKEEFLRLKVEGVRECAELFVVALAPDDGTVFGRRTLPYETALSSVACSIQNFCLAARAENLGAGWVSMFNPSRLAALMKIPDGGMPIAILCLGPVEMFYPRPMLELEQWRQPRALDELSYTDGWDDA